MNPGNGPKEIHTGWDGKVFTTDGSEIDLVAEGPTGSCPREWMVLEAPDDSTLAVEVVGVDGQVNKTREYPADLLVDKSRVLGLAKILAASDNDIVIFVTW